ncbi:MAG: lipopolysaccharide biosynthesis protein [Muribaculaceae bacterium]|nr:lipopolysaccharide biosynthesis protein [Muribaculaceae bacterium]
MIQLSKNKRTNLAVKNIGVSLLLKGGSILITFILVPLTLGYLNSYEYGIWLTLNSVLSWIYLLDIGMGNGLRNKLTEALALQDFRLGKIYVSTAFCFMALIIVVFYCLFLVAQIFLDWYSILNVDPEKVPGLNSIVTIVFGFVCVSFLFKMVGNIYMAHQVPAANDLMLFIGNILSLSIIYILTHTTEGSLLDVAMTFSAVPAAVYLIAFPVTFILFPKIRPSFKCVKKQYFSDLITLGVKFLVIQIAALISYMTSNIIISQMFGPEDVTPYNIAYKYFSIVITVFTIVLTPFWSAITDARVRDDYDWIKNIYRKLLCTWCVVVAGVVLMIVFAPIFYKIWIGDKVSVAMSLTVLCGLYVCLNTLCNIYSFILNGFGTLKVALWAAVIQAIIYIPLAIVCGRYFGLSGILIALCAVCLLGLTWAPYQCHQLIAKKAKGIWNS